MQNRTVRAMPTGTAFNGLSASAPSLPRSAREVLNAQSDAPQQIGPATHIETPVLGDEELDELIAKAKDAEEARPAWRPLRSQRKTSQPRWRRRRKMVP